MTPATDPVEQVARLQRRVTKLKSGIRRDRRKLQNASQELERVLRACREHGINVVREGADPGGNHGRTNRLH